MSSQQFQETYVKISEVSDRLLSFLREYRQGRWLEGDDTQGLQSVEEKILSVIEGLTKQKYEVAIVAPTSAGKSTFLNAIIGADILASEAAACTICRTNVRHINTEEPPQLLEYYENSKNPVVVVEGNAHDIQEKFLERTRQLRSHGKSNQETPERFELLYPIEAIQDLPALAGFTLIDTPGPNEWKSMSVDTVALKQVSLEALRTCKAVLFVLNYRSFKDKAVDELFQSITENRKELLSNNDSRIFFILNQVDLKSERDPEISETIAFLKKDLAKFGFPNPIVYPVSSLQGLLGKLIKQGTATEKNIKDFENFFAGKYTVTNERGRKEQLLPHEAAPQAIQDSGIIAVQEAIFQTVVETSGWILLNDALNVLEGTAKSIENTLNTQINGWEIEINSLRNKVEEYKRRSTSAKEKVDSVRRSIDKQKDRLLEEFTAGIDAFTEGAKEKIQEEIDNIAQSRSSGQKIINAQPIQKIDDNYEDENVLQNFINVGIEIAESLVEAIPVFGKLLAKTFKVASPLLNNLRESVPQVFTTIPGEQKSSFNPYVIRCNNQLEAEKTKKVINDFCAPHIQTWWLDTQDILIREGTEIRENLVNEIKEDIQAISDELSSYLGDALQVEININTIQFPSFEFKGIDAQVKYQQEVYRRIDKKKKTQSRCCNSDAVYYVDVPVEESRSFYEINLKDTARLIKAKLDEQAATNKALLHRVIKKQVDEDFRNAEKQILDYINKFQTEFDQLITKRQKYELKTPEVVELLKKYKDELHNHSQAIEALKGSLAEWKPS